MRKRREIQEASIAFLDVITCGFGAIILLLVISKIGLPTEEVVEEPQRLDTELETLQTELFGLRDASKALVAQHQSKDDELAQAKAEIARLNRRLSASENESQSLEAESAAKNKIEGQLQAAIQSLTDEMKRLYAKREQTNTELIGGVPVDSEYIIFIIDTSGSMFRFSWNRMIEQLVQTLNVYPEVKGIQVLNDMGTYMFPSFRGRWIPDTESRRRSIIKRLRTWNAFSNSSPVEGITQAIRTYYRPNRKISLYVFGDEFSGGSIRSVVDAVERINPKDRSGNPLVRIHAVGFPVQFAQPPHLQTTGIRFAALMRELTFRNGGTFVGLEDFR